MNLRRFVFLSMAMAFALAAAQGSPPFRDPSPHRTQFVTVASDVRLEVLDWGGTGRPLVFLAGYLTAHAYDDIAPKLTAGDQCGFARVARLLASPIAMPRPTDTLGANTAQTVPQPRGMLRRVLSAFLGQTRCM